MLTIDRCWHCYKKKLLHGFVHGCLRCIARAHVAIASACTQLYLYSPRFASLVAHFLECPVVFTEYRNAHRVDGGSHKRGCLSPSCTYDYKKIVHIPFKREDSSANAHKAALPKSNPYTPPTYSSCSPLWTLQVDEHSNTNRPAQAINGRTVYIV